MVYRGLSTADMWWCTFDGSSVSGSAKFGVPQTGCTPALAVFNKKLYCVHRGSHGNPKLYWTVFNGSGWNADTVMGTKATAHAPAVCGGKLHLVVRSGGML